MERALCLAGLFTLGVLGAQVPPSTTVDGPFVHPTAGRIEVRGVCRFDEKDMVCWDATGKLDPTLSERIKAFHLVNPGQELALRMGRKNRLVIFRRAADAGRPVTVQYTTGSNSSLNTTRPSWSAEESILEWVRMAVDPDISSVDINAVVTDVATRVLTLPYKVGERATVGSVGATIESVQEVPRQMFGGGWERPGKNYTVSVRLSGDLASFSVQTGYQLEDARGTVVAADSKGKVVTRERFDQEQRERMNTGRSQPPRPMETRSVYTWVTSRNPDVISTNVAPSPDLKLVLMVTPRTTIRFRNIPLDPR